METDALTTLAPKFAALGDPTRLAIVTRLAERGNEFAPWQNR